MPQESEDQNATPREDHLIVLPDGIDWTEGPDSLPAGYTVPPHTHPRTEHVTNLSGTGHVGMGKTLEPSNTTALLEDGFAETVMIERSGACRSPGRIS